MTPSRDQVMELLGRYAEAVSTFDLDLFAACWAPDAVWEVPGEAPDRIGTDEIVELFSTLRAKYPLCMQQILSVTIEADPAGADVRTQLCELQWREDGDGTELYGVYHDRVVLTEGRPVFTRRGFHARYRGRRAFPGKLLDG